MPTYIATGCTDGSLNLVTLACNQEVSSPMVAPRCGRQKVTCVKYSTVKVGRLCIRSPDHPHISFWDCNSNKNIFNLSPHFAPVTAITFSPINETQALSVGLDKKLVCDDTKTKKMIMSIQCENHLTAADFDIDGVSMAMGTIRGKVSIQSGYPVCPLSVIFCSGIGLRSQVSPRPLPRLSLPRTPV